MKNQHCGYCGYWGEMVFVHSHYQCPQCKYNIAPCCEGEQCETEPKKLENTSGNKDKNSRTD